MPKVKTRKSAAKRYKISSTGKIMRRKGGISHLRECKPPKSKTANKGMVQVHATDAIKISHMLPYMNK